MLTPQCGANAPAVMNVNFDGRTYSFEVKPGPDGYRQFTEAIRRAFSLPDDSELNITFTCDEPSTGFEPEPVPPSKFLAIVILTQGNAPPQRCRRIITAFWKVLYNHRGRLTVNMGARPAFSRSGRVVLGLAKLACSGLRNACGWLF